MTLEIPECRLDRGTQDRLKRIVGAQNFACSDLDRLSYGRDLWPRAVMWIRQGRVRYTPDCIVWPYSAEQVLKILAVATEAGLPVIPFGAGSGVCAAALPYRGGIMLDMKKMHQLLELDREMIEIKLIEAWGDINQRLAFTCPKCRQNEVYRAIACKQCQEIYLPRTVRAGQNVYKCPKCSTINAPEDELKSGRVGSPSNNAK